MSETPTPEEAPVYPQTVAEPASEAPADPEQTSAEAATPAETENSAAGQAPGAPTEEDILEALRDVIDPELGIDIVNLGLLYDIHLTGTKVVLDMTLTSAACPLTDVLEDQTAQALSGLVTSARINWVWLPPWGPERITPEGREMLQALGFNV